MKEIKKSFLDVVIVGGIVLLIGCVFAVSWYIKVSKSSDVAVVSIQSELPVVVIDAGHGGMDGGASAKDGTLEKDLNLEIAKKLQAEISKYPVKVVMTRTEDIALYEESGKSIRQKKREDLLERKRIIEEADPIIAISIHLNSFPEDASVYGAQVFYPKCKESISKEFAEAVQNSIDINIDDGRTRDAKSKSDILLFKDIKANIIMVECGFLSNPSEAHKLKDENYQEKMAKAIWSGVNEKFSLQKTSKIQIISSNKG